jgi:hypothetical protein
MSQRNWAMLGIILLLAGSCEAATGDPTNNRTDRQAAPADKGAKLSGTSNSSEINLVKSQIGRIAHAVESLNAKIPNQDDSAQRSATAEEWGSKWALGMLIVATIETAITGLGVLLVWKTLGASRRAAREAKRAADAAEKSIKVARNVGRAQARAYVHISDIGIFFSGDVEEDSDTPAIVITASNTGQSPALEFKWTPALQYICGDKIRQQSLAEMQTRGLKIPAHDEKQEREVIGRMEASDFIAEFDPPIPDSVAIRARIEFSYKDVFGVEFKDVAYFDGNARKADRFWIGGKEFRRWEGHLRPMPGWRNWEDRNPGTSTIQT